MHDQEGFTAFDERSRVEVHAAVAVTVGDHHLAADAVDEAFVRAREPSVADDQQPTLDLARLFETLVRHEVRYVVIGGIAAIVHGNKRATFDLDVTPQLDRANLERLAAALMELNAQRRGIDGMAYDLSPANPDHLGYGGNWTLTTDAGSLDIMGDPAGAAPYDDLDRRGVTVELWGNALRIVGLDDLIAMKRAAGRPKDLDDIAALSLVHRDATPAGGMGGRCGFWMPLAKRSCVLPAGHRGRHRSP